VGHTLRLLGDAHAGLGQLEQARARYERAVKILEAKGSGPNLALARFGLAKLLMQTGEREQALALGELARQALDGSERRANREEIAAWLAAQGRE
jgi:tetratricopeptide (TPR) repeat protein